MAIMIMMMNNRNNNKLEFGNLSAGIYSAHLFLDPLHTYFWIKTGNTTEGAQRNVFGVGHI